MRAAPGVFLCGHHTNLLFSSLSGAIKTTRCSLHKFARRLHLRQDFLLHPPGLLEKKNIKIKFTCFLLANSICAGEKTS